MKVALSFKFAVITMAVIMLLLGMAVALSLWSSYREAERAALSIQQEKAQALSAQVDGFLSGLQTQIAWTTQPDWKRMSPEQQRADFTRMLRQFPAITELYYIDGTGLEQIKVSRLAPDSMGSRISHAAEPRFTETARERDWFGPVYVRNGSDMAGSIGAAHTDGSVTVAELDLGFLGGIVKSETGDGAQAFIVDGKGRLIAHPTRNPATGNGDLAGLPQVAAAMAAGGSGPVPNAVSEMDGAPAFAAFAKAERGGWIAISEMPAEQALEPFQSLLWQSAAMLAMGLLVAAATGISLATRVTAPIGRLRAAAEQLGQGDLAQRVAIRGRDELGAFADTFNTMASRLQQSLRGLEAKADERAHGLDVALQQQTLTAGVMKAIGRADQNLETVLETLVGSAVQLCEADHGAIWLKDGDALKLAAQAGYPDEWATTAQNATPAISPEAGTPFGLAAWLARPVAVEDLIGDQRFEAGVAPGYAGGKAGLAVPLMHEGKAEGVIWLARVMALPFTDVQGELVQGFADQAVVAIENARLVSDLETRERMIADMNREQTAVADIIRQSAQAPGDAQAILERSVEIATRLLGADCAWVFLHDGQGLTIKAVACPSAEGEDNRPQLRPDPTPAMVGARAFASGAPVEIADAGEESDAFLLTAARSGCGVPLIRNGAAIGAIAVERTATGPLPARHIQLLTALADHAVVVLGTMSVWNDLHTRNAELATALDRQDASDSLSRAIASPAFDLASVIGTLERSLSVLCRADSAQAFRQRGDIYRAIIGEEQFAPGRGSIVGRVALDATVVRIADTAEDDEYQIIDETTRSVLGLPLMAGGGTVGVLTLSRAEAEPFSDDEASVATAFAELAAIAMEKANLLERAEHRDRQIADALHERAAASEMLKLVGRKSVDQETLLEVLAAAAADACGAGRVFVLETSGQDHRVAAGYGLSYEDRANDSPLPGWMTTALADARAQAGPVEHAVIWPGPNQDDDAGEERRLLAVPVQRDGAFLGAFILERTLSAPFSAGQIQLAENLADQAAVAMANIRLRDLLHRTEQERDASLARNSAAARLAGLIGGTVPDAQPVFDMIVSATELCGADAATLTLCENGAWRAAATSSEDAALDTEVAASLARHGRLVHVADTSAEPADELAAELAGVPFAAMLGIPLQLDGGTSGFLLLSRSAAGEFSERHIEFAKALADQAGVAFENERLFHDLRTRTAELDASLQREAAAAAMAEAINRNDLALSAVLPDMVASARLLAGADTAAIYLLDGGTYRLAAEAGMTEETRVFALENPYSAPGESPVAQCVLERTVVHISDHAADGGAMLLVPLLREGSALGVIALTRQEPGAFGAQSMELVRTFADLAVVAIENISLTGEVAALNAELGTARQEQRATAEASRIISSSAFDLMSLIDMLIGSAARLCGANSVRLYLGDGANRCPLAAASGATPEERGFDAASPPSAGDGTWIGEALSERTVVHVPDAHAQQPQDWQRYGQAGSVICVPLGTRDAVFGAMVMARDEAGGFAQAQVDLLMTLADQVVLAMEHTRLLADAQKRTDELAVLLEDLRAARTRLSETERLASVGLFTAGILTEIRDPLTFVGHFAEHSYRNINAIRRSLEAAVMDVATREDVEELADTLADSIKAVAEHSKRTDSIISNMLMHARGDSCENRLTDINALLDESLALASQKARAENPGFSVTLEKDFDPAAGHVDLYPHEMTRVFLNLIANGFQAMEQRRAEAGAGYRPVLSITTRDLGDTVEIRICDNGTGIANGVRERMFDPFFSTRPAGEGTGLGLSLSRDIVVNQHAGSVEVETEAGSFTELRIVLPRDGASLALHGGHAAQDAGEAALPAEDTLVEGDAGPPPASDAFIDEGYHADMHGDEEAGESNVHVELADTMTTVAVHGQDAPARDVASDAGVSEQS